MSEPKPEECDVCKIGVILGIAKHVCNQQGSESKPQCEDLYAKTVMGEIPIKEFLSKVRSFAKDPLDQKTLDSLEEVLSHYEQK